MEFVDGPSRADLLREHKQLEIDETVGIVRDACHGLDYAHRAGVVHRDVKPGNLLLAEETGTTKLADFGIAKAAEQTRITQVGSVLGTAAYLSPEQARGEEAGPASDIYSLGVCAYQFLTGRLPHEYGSLTELALKQQQDSVEPITELPARGAAASSTRRSGSASSASPTRATRGARHGARRSRPALRGEATDATQRLGRRLDPTRPGRSTSTAATQALQRTTVERAPRACSRRPPAAPAAQREIRAERDAAPPLGAARPLGHLPRRCSRRSRRSRRSRSRCYRRPAADSVEPVDDRRPPAADRRAARLPRRENSR